MIALAVCAAFVASMCLVLTGMRNTILIIVVFSMTVAPMQILNLQQSKPVYVVDISNPVVSIATYTLTLIISALYICGKLDYRNSLWWLTLPSITVLIVGCLLVWGTSGPVISGTLHAVLVCLAWIVGVGYAKDFSIDSTNVVPAMTLLCVSMILAIPSWMQWIGGQGAEGYGDRTGGIFSHPSTTGKVATVVLCLSLPFMRSASSRIASLGTASVWIAASAAIPSLSRANIIAIAIVIVGWYMMNGKLIKPITIASFALIGTIFYYVFFDEFVQRFLGDPEGGERPEMMAAALRQLPELLPGGTGPNNYVNVVSELEPIVSITGYPVHNILVLYLAEFGVLGLAAIALPLISCLRVAVSVGAARRRFKPYSDALFLLMVSVSFIGWTGWGILRQPLPELIVFSAAILCQNAYSARSSGTNARQLLSVGTDVRLRT